MKRYECNLASKIEAGLEPREVRRIAHSLFQTLQQLHAVGVVVKDIKPENVLIDQAGRPHIADFGISVVVTRTTKIMPTSISGTFHYLAPETFGRDGFYTEVDIWAMACLIVEMCTRAPPWAGLQMQQITVAVFYEREAPAVPDHAPEAALVRRCFAFDPKERPTAAELVAAFEPEAAELPELVGGMAASFARQIGQLTSEKDAATRALVGAQRDLVESIATNSEMRVSKAELERNLERANEQLAVGAQASESALRQCHVTLEASQRESISAKNELHISKAELEDLKRNLAASTQKRRELEKENQRLAGLQRGAMASAAPAQGPRRPSPAVRPEAAPAAQVAPVGPLLSSCISWHALVGWDGEREPGIDM
jgi:serine/threonine protein kinase